MEPLLKAPPFQPRLQTSFRHGLGLVLLFLIPVMACFELFGRTEEHFRIEAGEMKVSGSFPTKSRIGQTEHFVIQVENASDAAKENIELQFDHGYLHRFSKVVFFPEAREPYTVRLGPIPARSTAVARVEVEADEFGTHEGALRIKEGGRSLQEIPLHTLVFP